MLSRGFIPSVAVGLKVIHNSQTLLLGEACFLAINIPKYSNLSPDFHDLGSCFLSAKALGAT
jgi:hypothetical protein